MRLSKNDIATVVLRELNLAQGQDSDILSAKRSKALDYYNGLLPAQPVTVDSNGNATTHRNGVVSKDVADALHSLLAQIQPIVKTTSVEFEPEHQQDEPQAQAESDLIRKYIEREGGFTTIFSAIHDALLTGNGWIKIVMEEYEDVTEKHYPVVDELTQAILMLPKDDKETKEAEVEEDGTISIYTTRKQEKLCFKSIAPENILFSNNSNANGLDDLRFVAERKLFTVNELLDLGIKREVIDTIPDESNAEYNAGVVSRQGIYQNTFDAQSVQDSERLKLVYVCFIKIDLNNNGKSELREIWVGGTDVLVNEPANYIPYITGSAIPMPHRVEGTGLYELLAQIQDGKTYILRQYLDNLSALNGSRIAVKEGQVNMNDLTNGRVNGIVRVSKSGGMLADSIMALPSTDIGPQAMTGLNYFDTIRTARVGATVDFNEAQAQLMQSSTVAATGQLAKVEQMAGWFASNLVNTMIKPAFIMVHRLLREETSEPIQAKLRGQWITMNPSEWIDRKNVSITMGMTTSERASKINSLQTLAMQQQSLLQAGADGILVDFKKFYNTQADWIRASNLGDPSEYLIDPTSQEAQQAGIAKQQTMQQKDAEIKNLQMMLAKMEQDFELNKQTRELEFKYWDAKLKANVDEAKMETDILIQGDRHDGSKPTVGASGNT